MSTPIFALFYLKSLKYVLNDVSSAVKITISRGMKALCRNQILLACLLVLCSWALPARANIYATDIRLNGSTNTVLLTPGTNVTISYILNDTATGGVTVDILSGTNVIMTYASTNGAAGTNAGLNTVVWDGSTDDNQPLPPGTYTVSITAASTGYDTWTNITDDGPNFSAADPRGIIVNQNSNSVFYGRVFVASAPYNSTPGIIKCNADGSPGDEGGFATGGWNWGGNGYSPWKMTVGSDDTLYVDDFSDQGIVLSFDATLDTNSLIQVLNADNYPPDFPNVFLSGLAVIGTGTNVQLWMSDEDPVTGANPEGSAGIIGWQLTNGAAAANDPGFCVVPVDSDFLTKAPYDFAVDTNGSIYPIQYILPTDSPSYSLMGFPPYAGTQETTANWAVGMYPTLLEAYGVAVNPADTCLAVGVLGEYGDPEHDTAGGLYLYRTNGDFVSDLDQTGGDAYYDVAWDNVGNLYTVDDTAQVWRVYSPPGPNQATTVAVPQVQAYNAILPATLCQPAAATNMISFLLMGQSYVTYVIQRSCDLSHWCNLATNYSTNANRCLCLPVGSNRSFFRAVTTAP